MARDSSKLRWSERPNQISVVAAAPTPRKNEIERRPSACEETPHEISGTTRVRALRLGAERLWRERGSESTMTRPAPRTRTVFRSTLAPCARRVMAVPTPPSIPRPGGLREGRRGNQRLMPAEATGELLPVLPPVAAARRGAACSARREAVEGAMRRATTKLSRSDVNSRQPGCRPHKGGTPRLSGRVRWARREGEVAAGAEETFGDAASTGEHASRRTGVGPNPTRRGGLASPSTRERGEHTQGSHEPGLCRPRVPGGSPAGCHQSCHHC